MTKLEKRCPYVYFSLSQSTSQNNRCILKEGHPGVHIQQVIYAPPQPQPIQQGWIKQENLD